jgi:hypothetical protein
MSQSSACYLLRVGFLLGLFLEPEDGGDMSLRNDDFQGTTLRYIPEDRTPKMMSCTNRTHIRNSGHYLHRIRRIWGNRAKKR